MSELVQALSGFVRGNDEFVSGAACRGLPTEWWFPTQGMNVIQSPSLRMAKEMCEECKVRVECYEYGVATRSWGIWGGVTLNDGFPTRREKKNV